jgi:hypothetical protein
MKKACILFFLLCNIIFFVHAQGDKTVMGKFIKSGNRFILNLPYEIGDEVRTVFDEDTPLAIDIIEIRADGKQLSFIEDFGTPEGRGSFRVKEIARGENEYYILMIWRLHLGEYLRWNDGRGIIFVEITPNLFAHKTNTYEISRGMKALEIRYRILLPYPSLKVDELYNQVYTGNFSREKRMMVDISKVFD